MSVGGDVIPKLVKNQSWINTGKLKATVGTLNTPSSRQNDSSSATPKTKPRLRNELLISTCSILFVSCRDIIWDVCWNPRDEESSTFASASADRTAKIWRYDPQQKTAGALATYTAHTGSVNSVRFHPTQPILCTASGDRTLHIWKSQETQMHGRTVL